MTDKEIRKLRGVFKSKLTRVVNLAQSHCGHDELVAKFVYAEMDLAEWFEKQITTLNNATIIEYQKKEFIHMIYGKVFDSMFEGSLVGAGSDVFAVMAYVISHMQPDDTRDDEEYVRLHATMLSAAIGEPVEDMQAAIDYLCSPDKGTTTEGDEGRRIVKVEQFVYRVVNGKFYRSIIDEKDRKEKAKARQALYRERQKIISEMSPTELAEYNLAKQKELLKRRKGVGVRASRRAGKVSGGTQAVAEVLDPEKQRYPEHISDGIKFEETAVPSQENGTLPKII